MKTASIVARTATSGLPLLALALACTACAHTYIDATGNRHIVGLVNLTLPADSTAAAGDWVRMRTIGLSISRTDIASSIDLGYSDNTLAIIRDNSCAFIGQLPDGTIPLEGQDHASHPNNR
jgi:hypothetical protein